MGKSCFRGWWIFLLSLALLSSGVRTLRAQATGAWDDIFSEADTLKAPINAAQQKHLNFVKHRVTTAAIKLVVGSGVSKLIRGVPVSLNFPSNGKVQFIPKEVESLDSVSYLWHGSDQAGNMAMLVVRNGNITGTISIGQRQYRIEPLGNGLHALVLVNTAAFPPRASC